MKFFSEPKTAKLAKYPAMLLVLIGAARQQPLLMMLGLGLAMMALGWAFVLTKRADVLTKRADVLTKRADVLTKRADTKAESDNK